MTTSVTHEPKLRSQWILILKEISYRPFLNKCLLFLNYCPKLFCFHKVYEHKVIRKSYEVCLKKKKPRILWIKRTVVGVFQHITPDRVINNSKIHELNGFTLELKNLIAAITLGPKPTLSCKHIVVNYSNFPVKVKPFH